MHSAAIREFATNHHLSAPSRLTGYARDIQTTFAILFWGWVIVLVQPQDIFKLHPGQYFGLMLAGDRVFWASFTAPVAVIASVALRAIPLWLRSVLTGLQVGWLLAVTVFFAMTWPPVTGVPAYGAFFYLAACLLRRPLYAERG